MAKEILGLIKLQIPAGGANPSPPVGPALCQRGLNIMDFCKAFNEKTKKLEKGSPIPVVITIYKDGGIIQEFTGNDNPRNTRVVLIDERGIVIFFMTVAFLYRL